MERYWMIRCELCSRWAYILETKRYGFEGIRCGRGCHGRLLKVDPDLEALAFSLLATSGLDTLYSGV